MEGVNNLSFYLPSIVTDRTIQAVVSAASLTLEFARFEASME